MGQKMGKVAFLEIAQPFSNLPKRAIMNIWQVFNNIADGFGVRADELEEICIDLKDELNISRVSMQEKISTIFTCFDTDNNGLIDALEFFSSIAVLSGMKKRAIMEFILTIYDFDGTESLSLDEVVLALKSVSTGLCKLQAPQSSTREKVVLAKEEQIEQLVSELFCSQSVSGEVDDSVRLSVKILCTLLIAHPDVNYWFSYFSNPPQTGLPTYELTFRDKDFASENPIQVRTGEELLAVEWNVRCEEPVSGDASANSAGTMGTTGTAGTAKSGASAAKASPAAAPRLLPVPSQPAAPPGKEEQWRSAVALLTPVEFSGAVMKKASPNCSMHPEWVYGYQSEKAKCGLHYTSKGDIVYNISKYVVIYSIKLHQQRVFSGHTDEVLSLKLHPNRLIAASGEIGPVPKLLVWNTETRKILYSASGFHQNGVTQLCFSLDGKILVSVGNDSQQSISVCLWEEGTVLFTSPVSSAPALCLSCTVLRDNTIVAAGDSYVHFWSYYSEGYVRRVGNFSRFTAMQPVTALAAVCDTDNLVSGTASGLLLLWVDVNCVRSVKAHNGTINSIFSCSHGILSGGKDQRIRMWSINLEPSFTFDVSHYGMNACVRSLCMSSDGTSILLGTKGANIFEISAIDGSDLRGGPIAVGHSSGDLYSLATHPSKFEFLTVGQDQTLRAFDMSTNTQLKIATFDGDARTVAFNPMGDIIVVGFSGPPGSAKAGAFVVLNEEDLSIVHEAKDSSCSVTIVEFSPEGETLAVGCSDGGIYLYAVHDDYELVGKCDRHESAVTQIDFSKDGEWLRSNSEARELFFFNTDDASFQSNISSMRDVQWATNNCTFSWHVKEVHHSPFAADDMLCNHLLPIPEELAGTVEPYLACGSSMGYVRLYPFPCVTEGSEYHRYPAHCSEVAAVKFAFDGSRLVSVGQKDRCIVQWKCLPYGADTEVQVPLEEVADDLDLKLEALQGPVLQEAFMPAQAKLAIGLLNAPAAPTANMKKVAAEITPSPENDAWLVSVVEPTTLPNVRAAIPELSLLLEHVYGYESQTMRNNVRYTSDDEIVYTVSTMGIVLNTTNKAQRIYKFHSDAITSFACSRDGSLVVTGQMGHRPLVSIWDARTCTTKCLAPETQLYSVCCVAISPDKDYIALVNLDKDHTISVYDWRTNVVVSKFYGGANHILGVFFTEYTEEEGSGSGLGLVSYGVKELRFWKAVTTRFPTSVRPKIGAQGTLQTFLCGEVFNGRPVIGTSDGFLYTFSETALTNLSKGHSGPLTAMDVSAAKKWLVSGGKDGTVRVWNSDMSCIKEFVLDSLLESVNPSVRSVAFNSAGTHLVIGTRGSEIFEVSIVNGTKVSEKCLVEGHGIRQLWGLASHPTKEECVTTGDDSTLRLWDCKNYLQKRVLKMDTASRAVCYSSDGKLIAVGFGSGKRIKGKLAPKEGAFAIMRAADMKIVHEGKDSNSAIRVVKFSPDSKTFAVASDDNNIYTYNVKDEYTRRSTIKCHQSPVMYLDFSSESNYIVSVDSSRTVCFTEVNTGVTIPTPEALRDEKWVTTTNPYMWAVKGLWESQPPGVLPITVQKSWGGLLLAGGSNAGSLTVAHNPYPQKAGFVQCAGHAGRISSLAWVAGDGAILSIGTKDHTLMQWKCLYDNTRESGDEGARSCEDSEMEIDGGHELSRTALRVSGIVASAAPLDGSATAAEQKSSEERQLSNWYSMVCAPSNIRDDDQALPDAQIELDFAQGPRLGDCRKLLRYNEDGKAIYVVSTVAVIYDRSQVTQLYYMGHRDAIISLDVDTTGKIAVTGEQSELPEVHIWDAKTGNAIKRFEQLHRQGVSSVSFSANAEYLVSLGQDVHNSIAICHSPSKRWTDGHHICSTSVSSSKMLWCMHSSSSSAFPIVVGGAAGHVYFFRVVRGEAERVKGVYGKRHKIQPMLCAIDGVISGSSALPAAAAEPSPEDTALTVINTNTVNVMLCGTVTGYIYIFSNTKVVNRVPAHEAPVNAICPAGKRFLTAGKDGKVKLWSNDFKIQFVFNTASYLPRPFLVSCHAVTCNRFGTSFLVGMRSGEIFEVSLQSHTHSLLAEGHSRGEVHALDNNPANGDEYATAGDDGVVMVWSISKRYCLRKVRVEAASRAVAYSPNGQLIAVGFGAGEGNAMASKDGAIMILDANTLEIIREERRAKQMVTDLKYSPGEGELLAVASSDGRVYLHGTKKYDLLRVIETPSRNCAVSRIDFSHDSSTLRICTNFDQLFFAAVQTGDFVPNPTLVRDHKWHDPTCPFTWFAQGTFRRGVDGVDVSAVTVHPTGSLIATSYRSGEVRVYRYPCQSQQGQFMELRGVASDATRIKFTADGKYLVILDCKTRSVLQFRVSIPAR